MRQTKFEFLNEQGVTLSAEIQWPANQRPHTYAIFAHCFTCGKNFHPVRNISKALAARGFAVLSFDFTGLGNSGGEFAESSFSANVSDVVSAAAFLEHEFRGPGLLVGHSLGGASVIQAASRINSVRAVATIASPANVQHVEHLFNDALPELREKGIASVNIGGRHFTIKRDFIADLAKHNVTNTLSSLRKPVLILHSPQDRVVGIDHASLLYQSARHPKSFVSLDDADHLVSAKKDSHYAGEVIAAWAQRYLQLPEKDLPETEHQTVALVGDKNSGYTTLIRAGKHAIVADEPEDVGGDDFGPSPYQLLGAALASCTAMTLRMYANRKNISLNEVKVHVNHSKKHSDDLERQERIDHFERIIEIDGELTEDQQKRLLEIANRCPVHRTLENHIQINTRML
jgi:uncharacterized OsmC-like protein/pimeloyl-ACP methyl ester carboxylesterase